MAEVKASSSKRRRISPINSIALCDLPNDAMCHTASYLARPSRVLFVLALFGHESNDVRDNGLSSAILGVSGEQRNREQLDVLDFGAIEKSLAAKITDDVLKSILTCIDANTKLRKLKLAGCVNITGAGLDPLRGSAVLEQIVLSLVAEHKSPILDADPLLSCEHLLPILDSIIERDDNVLRSITFPECWRRGGRNSLLNEFMGRCDEVFQRRSITCTECDESVEEIGRVRGLELGPDWFTLQGAFYGLQNYTCYSCSKHFCYSCSDEGKGLTFCGNCVKEYCHECAPVVEECKSCHEYCCKGCMTKCVGSSAHGHQCNKKFCESCAPSGKRCDVCELGFRRMERDYKDFFNLNEK